MFDMFEDIEFGTPVTIDGEEWVILKTFNPGLFSEKKDKYSLAVKAEDLLPATPQLVKLPDDYDEQVKARAEKAREALSNDSKPQSAGGTDAK